MRILTMLVLGSALAGCASSTTTPVTQDTFNITASTAAVCGSAGAEKVAFKQAAAETIRRGYDRFVVVGGRAGGVPIYGGVPGTTLVAPNQGLVVKMLRDNDPGAAKAVSARDTLGPKWQELAAKDAITCLD